MFTNRLKTLLIGCFLFIGPMCYAQSYFNTIYDGNMWASQQNSTHCMGMDGGILTLSESTGEETLLLKTSRDGSIEWSKLLRNPEGRWYVGAAALPDSSFVLLGSLEAPTGAIRYWTNLVRISNTGEIVWRKAIEAYHNFIPTAIGFKNNEIHISGTTQSSEYYTQVFYAKLDLDANLLAFDTRQAEYMDEIQSISFIDDWTMLAGTSYWDDQAVPVMVGIDPGGNIRYFFYVETDESGYITDVVETPKGLAACGYYVTGEGFIFQIENPVNLILDFKEVKVDGQLQFRAISTDNDGNLIVTGSFQNVPTFYNARPVVGKFDVNGNVDWIKNYEQTGWTDLFNDAFVKSDKSMYLVGNQQLGHYYGVTISYCDSNGNGACSPIQLAITEDEYEVAIFTHVPESRTIEANMTNGVSLSQNIVIDTIMGCKPSVPTANFEGQLDGICINECLTIKNTSTGASQLEWYFEGGVPEYFVGQNPPEICYSDSGVFIMHVIASNSEGSDTAQGNIHIVDNCDPYVFVPNAFSPNNKGSNEFFGPKYQPLTPYSLKIYSTYGELLFDKHGQPQWNGTYEGAECPMGWYFYRILFDDKINRKADYSGIIYLMR